MTQNWAWKDASNPEVVDLLVASMGGHPLQSVLWGNARRRVDGLAQILLECHASDGQISGGARIEVRSVPVFGAVAWIPKGPLLPAGQESSTLAALRIELKQRGFIACITDRYVVSNSQNQGQPHTIWLDLTLGLEALSRALDSQWRYGARRALREGVVVRTTTDPADVSVFFRLCNALGETKGFSLPGSEALMQNLIRSSTTDGAVAMSLYVGEVGGTFAGGALVARSGKHLHYLWGASDRRFSKYRVSEAVQWRIIENGVAAGMTRYDLEGIDPVSNPGVCAFKRKMGGQEVALQGMDVQPLSLLGRISVDLGRWLGKLN